MLRLLHFIFGPKIFKVSSYFVKFILSIKGIKVGRNFYIQGIPALKCRGLSSNIVIGENVSFFGNVDIRNRENGKIIIENGCSFDNDCRLVSANDATLLFKKNCSIGGYNVFNAGDDIIIGEDTLMSGFCFLQSSNHGTSINEIIKNQNHTYGKIIIGNDCWIASNVTIVAGVKIGDGAIVGANAVVTKDLEPNSKNVGIPAKQIGERK